MLIYFGSTALSFYFIAYVSGTLVFMLKKQKKKSKENSPKNL